MTDTLGSLLRAVSSSVGSPVEARWITAHAAGLDDGALLARLDDPVTTAVADAAAASVRRLQGGEPLQYVLGRWGFRQLDVRVDARALVPRPETEQVVGFALGELERITAELPTPTDPLVVADLGTGSGVIALSLATEGPRSLEVWATDASVDALELFEENLTAAARYRPDITGRVYRSFGSWFGALPTRLAGRLHLVVANPPYVSEDEWEVLDPVVRDHEPRGALVSGPTGLEDLDVVVRAAVSWLIPGGALVLELAPHQADAVTALARRAGFSFVEVRPDLTGRPRALVARPSHDGASTGD
jgi:release factor glutamine methyltransferase